MEEFKAVLQKYAVFSGRSSRREYWMYFLFYILFAIGISILESIIGIRGNDGNGPLSLLYSLAMMVPTIAVGIRRMHDVNKSGWYLLIPIYNLILAVTSGDTGSNKYGPAPKK